MCTTKIWWVIPSRSPCMWSFVSLTSKSVVRLHLPLLCVVYRIFILSIYLLLPFHLIPTPFFLRFLFSLHHEWIHSMVVLLSHGKKKIILSNSIACGARLGVLCARWVLSHRILWAPNSTHIHTSVYRRIFKAIPDSCEMCARWRQCVKTCAPARWNGARYEWLTL